MTEKPFKFLGFQAPPAMFEKLKKIAEQQDRSVSAVLRRATEKYLAIYEDNGHAQKDGDDND